MANRFSGLAVRIAADGTVTYDFEGHISARGLDLPAGTQLSPPDDSRVRWLRESDDDVVADVFALETAGGRRAQLQVYAPDFPGGALDLTVIGDTEAGGVVIGHDDATPVLQQIWAYSAGQFALLVSGDRKSSFPWLAESGGPHERAINYGLADVQTDGVASATLAVAHGLGRVPKAVVGTVKGAFGRGCQIFTYTATQFTVRVNQHAGGAMAGDTPVSWVAIG